MYDEIKRRLTWIKLYKDIGDAALVRHRCGISRPTLRKWWRRYIEDGLEGLAARSRRPHHSPNKNVFEQEEAWILALRREQKPGARRIRHELRRLNN